MLARLVALFITEVRAELERLDPAPPAPPVDTHRYDPASVTSGSTERTSTWDHDVTPPVRAFGFGPGHGR